MRTPTRRPQCVRHSKSRTYKNSRKNMIRTASQVVAERVIWAASGPPLGAWAGAHGWSMFSHRRFEVSDAAPASKDFPAGAHELGRKTFPRWAALFLSAAQQSLSL